MTGNDVIGVMEDNRCIVRLTGNDVMEKTTFACLLQQEELDIAVLPPSDSEAGVLPAELRRLVESRRQVKGLMKSSNLSPEQILQVSSTFSQRV